MCIRDRHRLAQQEALQRIAAQAGQEFLLRGGFPVSYTHLVDTKAVDIFQPASSLSGGNQQKVVVAKALSQEMKVVIMDEPTKGVDVGAKAEIYAIMGDLAKKGYAIILISSEMPEILGMSDRIVVMCNGRKTGELGRGEATQEMILELAMDCLLYTSRCV